MQLWQDGLVAMLAAVGLASILWAVVRTVLYRDPQPNTRSVCALIPAQGDGTDLEQHVRTLQHLRQEHSAFGPILLVDCGLTSEGQKLARLLAKEDRWVSVCGREEIGRYLE